MTPFSPRYIVLTICCVVTVLLGSGTAAGAFGFRPLAAGMLGISGITLTPGDHAFG